MEKYTALYTESIEQKELFWARQAEQIHWFKQPSVVLSQTEKGFYRWFADGEINAAYLCLDYHVENGRAGQTA
jgi:propionyl-CoA synthetase